MATKHAQGFAVFVTAMFLAGAINADEVHFLGGVTPPARWVLVPANPTTKDVIHFQGPLWTVYSNACVAAVAAGAEPELSIAGHVVELCAGEPLPPGTVCPMVMDPVCGLAGEFGPLSAGDWVFECSYPIAVPCRIEFRVDSALVLLFPNGGENLAAGSRQRILWQSGDVTEARVEYSVNNGLDWVEVDPPNVGNTGSYEWIVPDVNSQHCLVRVSDVANPQEGDTSDQVFTIFVCQRSLAGDLNNDCYVDFRDIAVIAMDWLNCGNPYDPLCQH